MFQKPECGWTDFSLGEYKSRASYLTNIPQDCIDAFTYGLKNNKPVVVYFDAEGWEFYLVCDYYHSYVIEDKDEPKTYYINKGLVEVAKEFISDIEKHYKEWRHWNFQEDPVNIDLSELKELLNK